MKLREVFAPIGAILALALAIIEFFQPADARLTRVGPGIWLVIAALMAARTALRIQQRNRRETVKQVPKHPLGLDDEG
ncbi:MAG: hypothetical protein JO307_27950 [Bryobacterales bacterium]|nr:hypothetical protein [Bryobacterales bacterium]